MSLVTGRDATLRGAVVQGQDVNALIGRNLLIESLQDNAGRDSSSSGFNFGLTYGFGGTGFGFNGGFNFGSGFGIAGRVAEQSSLIARGGALNATVIGNTRLIGGVIAALDGGRGRQPAADPAHWQPDGIGHCR